MASYPIFTAEGENHFTQAYEQFEGLVGQLNDPASQTLTHGAVEALIQTEGMELLRPSLWQYPKPHDDDWRSSHDLAC